MFLFFKPPQSFLQVQLLDPDGPDRRRSAAIEEAYAIKILQERQAKQQEKRKSLSFKKRIKQELEGGKTAVEIAQELSTEIIATEPKFEFTEEVKADVARIMAAYQRQVQLETQSMVLDFANELARKAAILEVEYRRRVAEKKRRILNNKKIQALLLFATLDEEDE